MNIQKCNHCNDNATYVITMKFDGYEVFLCKQHAAFMALIHFGDIKGIEGPWSYIETKVKK